MNMFSSDGCRLNFFKQLTLLIINAQEIFIWQTQLNILDKPGHVGWFEPMHHSHNNLHSGAPGSPDPLVCVGYTVTPANPSTEEAVDPVLFPSSRLISA